MGPIHVRGCNVGSFMFLQALAHVLKPELGCAQGSLSVTGLKDLIQEDHHE